MQRDLALGFIVIYAHTVGWLEAENYLATESEIMI